jgi:hypothetical protein
MGGIHRSRVAASKAHRYFVKEVRRCSKSGLADPQGRPFTGPSWEPSHSLSRYRQSSRLLSATGGSSGSYLYTRNPVSVMILTMLRKYSGALISIFRCSDHVR